MNWFSKHNWVKGTNLPTKENAHNGKVVVYTEGMVFQVYWYAVKPGTWWAEIHDYEKQSTNS